MNRSKVWDCRDSVRTRTLPAFCKIVSFLSKFCNLLVLWTAEFSWPQCKINLTSVALQTTIDTKTSVIRNSLHGITSDQVVVKPTFDPDVKHSLMGAVIWH